MTNTPATTSAKTVVIDGQAVPLRVRRNRRARRMILRLDRPGDGVVVTLPPGVAERHVPGFVAEHADWIAGRLAALPPAVPFADGAVVPFLGGDHRIRAAGGRGTVTRAAGELRVAGRPEHIARRLTDWFRAEARRVIAPLAADKAARIGRSHGRITVRDTRSRWGSCASTGALSFSWRLVMAPAFVVDYVVAHEVAHLQEAHHGPAFWSLAGALADDLDGARAWLRENGAALHRYG